MRLLLMSARALTASCMCGCRPHSYSPCRAAQAWLQIVLIVGPRAILRLHCILQTRNEDVREIIKHVEVGNIQELDLQYSVDFLFWYVFVSSPSFAKVLCPLWLSIPWPFPACLPCLAGYAAARV